ncbi:MAG: hypothetical protein K2X27_21645 [Candidatus Obscuribacterales bacterium]|nr:hypothetical protein [Candidatus Obscuribacterales bacterium]
MNKRELESIKRKIDAFDTAEKRFWQSFAHSLSGEMDWELDFCELAIQEYKKFTILSPGNMVPSICVDSVWHLHLLHTRAYQHYCKDGLGIPFLHHQPSPDTVDAKINDQRGYLKTLIAYENYFGKPPVEIWGGDAKSFAKRNGISPA